MSILRAIVLSMLIAAGSAPAAHAQPGDVLRPLEGFHVLLPYEALYSARAAVRDFGEARGFVVRTDESMLQMFRTDIIIKAIASGSPPDRPSDLGVWIADGVREADPAEVARLLADMTTLLSAIPGAAILPGAPGPSVYATVPPSADPIAVVAIEAPSADLAAVAEDVAHFADREGFATRASGSGAAGIEVQLYRIDMAVLGRAEATADRATLWLSFYQGPMRALWLRRTVRGIVARAGAHDGVEARWVE